MTLFRRIATALLLTLVTASGFATELNCRGASNVEEFRYSWRLRGGIRFLAGMMFPTSGVGNLRTVYPKAGEGTINSELLITAPTGKSGGFYAYESQMDHDASRTLMTYHGYAWGEKARNERTVFDYVKGLARIHKVTTEETENRVKKLPSEDQLRDVLTAIQFLRQNAQTIRGPVTTSIYSDGKEYPVIFRPGEQKVFEMSGKRIAATSYQIVDAPGGKKWPGGVKVWLSNDDRRIPFRIEIQQSVATMQLDLQSVEACAFLVATK
ncbi:MAG TPA: DUF3108 domain-containing protein [Thermoanaerobaculia bacterium]|jgi:hypothetical protein